MPEYYVDTAQQESLAQLDKLLKAGKLQDVRDTADYWKKYTRVEIDYIIKNKRKK